MILTDEGRKAVRRDHRRGIQHQAERSDAALSPELERGAKERQSNKQRQRVGCFHVTPLEEAESHFHEIVKKLRNKFHNLSHSANQLILFHKNTFEPGVKTEEVIPGTSVDF